MTSFFQFFFFFFFFFFFLLMKKNLFILYGQVFVMLTANICKRISFVVDSLHIFAVIDIHV